MVGKTARTVDATTQTVDETTRTVTATIPMGDVSASTSVSATSVRVALNLTRSLNMHQQTGLYTDLVLAFSCGTTCSVHKCVMAAMSR